MARVRPPAPPLPPAPRDLVPPLLGWFAVHARELPWRRTRDPYAIWISEVMLQQTQVKTVIPYWERWRRALPDVHALAAASEDRVLKLWEGLGYYSRARNLQRAARRVVAEQDGRFPDTLAGLLALPGIGRYTAGAIASIAGNQPAPIVDGNIIRVLTRLFALPGNPKEKTLNSRLWSLAQELVTAAGKIPDSRFQIPNSTGHCSTLNQSLMELGATVCTPQAPRCPACPLTAHCLARRTGCTGEFPQLPARAAATRQRFVVAVLERGGKFLVRQRPAPAVNAGLWEFPNEELGDQKADARRAAAAWLGLRATALSALRPVRHSITRYRITLEVFRAGAGRKRLALEAGAAWADPAMLERLAFTSAHRRIVGQLTGPQGRIDLRRQSGNSPAPVSSGQPLATATDPRRISRCASRPGTIVALEVLSGAKSLGPERQFPRGPDQYVNRGACEPMSVEPPRCILRC